MLVSDMWDTRLGFGPREIYKHAFLCRLGCFLEKFKGKALGFEARLCLSHGSSPNYLVTMGRKYTSLNLRVFVFKKGFYKGKLYKRVKYSTRHAIF